jgi:hypothetical protein
VIYLCTSEDIFPDETLEERIVRLCAEPLVLTEEEKKAHAQTALLGVAYSYQTVLTEADLDPDILGWDEPDDEGVDKADLSE